MSGHVERFEVALEHDIDEQYQYEPGEVLRGEVMLHLKEATKVKVLQVHIQGEASVSWEEEENQKTKGPALAYTAGQTLVNVATNLLSAPEGVGNLLTVEAGHHSYPIEFSLPTSIPSSFIGRYGSITYVVKATLKEDKRLGLNTVITSEPFLVLRHFDLTQQHNLQISREQRVSRRFHGALALCRSGKVSATFKINKTGFIPGEDILMDAEISNSSPRIVVAVEAALIMVSTFTAKTKTVSNSQTVNRKRDDWELTQDEGRRWKGVRLTVPPYIPESRLDGCDIISIAYEVAFKLEISGNQVLESTIPITMGTVGPSEVKAKRDTATVHGQNWGIGENGLDVNRNGGAHPTDIDIELYSDETLKFRRPMEFGETRHNPLMEFEQDDEITSQEKL